MTTPTTPMVSEATAAMTEGLTLAEFEPLLHSVLDVAYRTAYHLASNSADAEDVVQEAALNACRHRGSFQRGSNFKAWFLRIVANVFYSRCRKASVVHESVSLDEAMTPRGASLAAITPVAPGANPAEALLARLDLESINRAIAELPTEYRAVTALYLVDDLAYQDIAAVLEIPVGTVRSRLHRGRRLLQRELWQLAADRGMVSGGH